MSGNAWGSLNRTEIFDSNVDRLVYSRAVLSSTPSLRKRTLRSANEWFYLNGVRATGIDRIIAESGGARPTFYDDAVSKECVDRRIASTPDVMAFSATFDPHPLDAPSSIENIDPIRQLMLIQRQEQLPDLGLFL